MRHGESYSNLDEQESIGHEKDLLTGLGRTQAQHFCDNFVNNSDLLIMSSSYNRAKQTAEPLIQKYPNAKFEVLESASEFKYLSDQLTAEEKKLIRKEYWMRNDPDYRTLEALENFVDFVGRVDKTIEILRGKQINEIVLFTHAKFMRLLILRLIHRKDVELKDLMISLNGYKHRVGFCDTLKIVEDDSNILYLPEYI